MFKFSKNYSVTVYSNDYCECVHITVAAVEFTGQAKAEAQLCAEAANIEGEAAVEQVKLKAEASKIEAVSNSH